MGTVKTDLLRKMALSALHKPKKNNIDDYDVSKTLYQLI